MVSAFRLFLRPSTTTYRSLALRVAPVTTFALVSILHKVPTYVCSAGIPTYKYYLGKSRSGGVAVAVAAVSDL